jgi:hypothetical protein
MSSSTFDLDMGDELKEREVICPYCNRHAELVGGDVIYPHRHDLARKKFWLCTPCVAYVGCHVDGDGTKPLGRLANAELRAAKQAAHAAFDPLWSEGRHNRPYKRKAAYAWLAEQLGIDRKRCHIGEFDVETCERVVAICSEHGNELRPA